MSQNFPLKIKRTTIFSPDLMIDFYATLVNNYDFKFVSYETSIYPNFKQYLVFWAQTREKIAHLRNKIPFSE